MYLGAYTGILDPTATAPSLFERNKLGIELCIFCFRFVDAVDELISSWLAVRLFAFQMVAIGEVFQFVVVSVKPNNISSVHES
jgi:hypothetical protein